MRNLLTLLAGICLIASSVGCCCMSGGCQQPYYGGYGTGCPTGQCAPAGGPVYPQTGYTTGYTTPVATAPQTYYSGYPSTALAPAESLPTY